MRTVTKRAGRALVVLAVGLGCGGRGGGADAAVADDGAICRPNDRRICADDGDVYWVDSCGNQGDLFAECTAEKACNMDVGNCCLPVATDGTFADSPILSQVTWTSPGAAAELRIRFELLAFAALGQAQGVRFQGTIDGRVFELGLRTDLADTGDVIGTGIDYVGRIGSEDGANVEFYAPSYFDTKPDDGGLVRINRPTMLGPRSTVEARLSREEGEGGGDWFALYLVLDGGDEELMGRILFPRQSGSASSIDDGESLLLGRIQRDGTFTVADVGKVQARVTIPLFDGSRATGATLVYPLLPPDDVPFPNADVTWESATETMLVSQGGVAPKCTDAGELF